MADKFVDLEALNIRSAPLSLRRRESGFCIWGSVSRKRDRTTRWVG